MDLISTTSLSLPVPFYHLFIIGFPSAPPISRSTGKPGMPVLPCQTVALSGIWNRRIYILFKLTNNTTFLDDMPFSLFQKISFHRVGAYIYFTIQGIDCKAVSMLFPFRWLRPRITVKAISYPLAGIPP